MNPPDEGTRERIMREVRIKEAVREQGRREGRAEAAAEFRRELDQMKKKVDALWDAFCKEPTRRIEQLDDELHG